MRQHSLLVRGVMQVQSIERMRTHKCTHQKTAINTQGALEARHINPFVMSPRDLTGFRTGTTAFCLLHYTTQHYNLQF